MWYAPSYFGAISWPLFTGYLIAFPGVEILQSSIATSTPYLKHVVWLRPAPTPPFLLRKSLALGASTPPFRSGKSEQGSRVWALTAQCSGRKRTGKSRITCTQCKEQSRMSCRSKMRAPKFVPRTPVRLSTTTEGAEHQKKEEEKRERA